MLIKTHSLRRLALALAVTALTSPAAADLTGDELRVLCLDLGASPEAMAVLGMSLSTGQQALGRLAEQDGLTQTFRQQQQTLSGLMTQAKTARAEARAATEPTEIQRLAGVLTDLEAQIQTATAAVQTSRSQLLAAFLPESVSPTLAARVMSDGPTASLPPEYRVAELSTSQVAELTAALAAERHAQARGVPLSGSVQQTLATYRAIPAISAARGGLAGHGSVLRTLFFQWP